MRDSVTDHSAFVSGITFQVREQDLYCQLNQFVEHQARGPGLNPGLGTNIFSLNLRLYTYIYFS